MTEMLAVISDIHGNYEALLAVANDARARAAEVDVPLRFICLGDVVGYGPQPNECVAWVARECEVIVVGNHDEMALAPLDQLPDISFRKDMWAFGLWTRLVLHDRNHATLQRWASQVVLRQMFWAVHSPDEYYVRNVRQALGVFERDDWPAPYMLFGHSHQQGAFIDDQWKQQVVQYLVFAETLSPIAETPSSLAPANDLELHAANPVTFQPCPRHRTLFNPGSIGQPRQNDLLAYHGYPHHDPRAAYLLLLERDGSWWFQYRRVPYRLERTLELLARVRWPDEHGAGHVEADYHPASRVRAQALSPELQAYAAELPGNVRELGEILAGPASLFNADGHRGQGT